MNSNIQPDEYRIKLSGTTEISHPLSPHEDYGLIIDRVAFEDFNVKNLHDGSERITYKLKPLSFGNLTAKDKVIEIKDPRSLSQKLRGRLYGISSDEGTDPEEDYRNFMQKCILYADEVKEFLASKN